MTTVDYRGYSISRQGILAAMAQFDQLYPDTNLYDRWLEKGNYKYAAVNEGRLYPPKHILSVATGLSSEEHYGGWGPGYANRVFAKLGFEVIRKQQRNPSVRSR